MFFFRFSPNLEEDDQRKRRRKKERSSIFFRKKKDKTSGSVSGPKASFQGGNDGRSKRKLTRKDFIKECRPFFRPKLSVWRRKEFVKSQLGHQPELEQELPHGPGRDDRKDAPAQLQHVQLEEARVRHDERGKFKLLSGAFSSRGKLLRSTWRDEVSS